LKKGVFVQIFILAPAHENFQLKNKNRNNKIYLKIIKNKILLFSVFKNFEIQFEQLTLNFLNSAVTFSLEKASLSSNFEVCFVIKRHSAKRFLVFD